MQIKAINLIYDIYGNRILPLQCKHIIMSLIPVLGFTSLLTPQCGHLINCLWQYGQNPIWLLDGTSSNILFINRNPLVGRIHTSAQTKPILIKSFLKVSG